MYRPPGQVYLRPKQSHTQMIAHRIGVRRNVVGNQYLLAMTMTISSAEPRRLSHPRSLPVQRIRERTSVCLWL